MGTIHIKYDEVYAETAKLKGHLASNVVARADAEYRQMQSNLRNVDGAASAAYSDFIEENRRKTAIAANTIVKLLDFMENSARQIEASEQRIARAISTARRLRSR